MKYLLPLLLSFGAHAQSFLPLDIPVFENSVQLNNPWAGGLNAPQWASLDMNGDGVQDLYAFDRNGDVHLSFVRQDATPDNLNFKYEHDLTLQFPNVRYFVLMRDFNGDEVPDLFCSSFDEFQSSVKVYRGHWEDNQLEFERMTFPELEHDVLHYEMDGEIIDQVKVFLASDYPAIDDFDGDGDLDILSMKQSGDKVIFYKNMVMEKGLSMDTLVYELADECWGKFGILPDNEGFVLSPSPSDCAFLKANSPVENFDPPHGGSTLLTFDAEGDGDQDLLFGDLIFPNLTLGINGGDDASPWINAQDVEFPSGNIPVDIPNFPSSFHLDVNQDGAKDLIASPNLMEGSPDVETVHFYQNEGTDEEPDFQFQTSNLLADEMLDFGTGAAPVIVDVNADGLLDIVVGNRYQLEGIERVPLLALLENVGTAAEPAFEVKDRDWLNLSEWTSVETALVPAFGDLDNDGDMDLLLGGENGNLHFAENTAGPNEPMEFAPIFFNWKNIDVGNFAAPAIADMNEDGLPDLLVGEQFGTVKYFPNIGTSAEPDFHPVIDEAPNNNFFGEINTQALGSVVGSTQPVVLDFGMEKQIVCGTFRGWHPRYLVDETKLDAGAFELLDERWGGLREGRFTKLAFANLNEDDFQEAVVGNDRGGLTVFRSSIGGDGTVDVVDKIENEALVPMIFPNPTTGIVKFSTVVKMELSVHDALGNTVLHRFVPKGETMVSLPDLPAGNYTVMMKSERFAQVQKLLLIQPR